MKFGVNWQLEATCNGETRKTYNVLLEQPVVKHALGRQRSRWDDNIRMNLREVGFEDER
jgi:hypothetical protein